MSTIDTTRPTDAHIAATPVTDSPAASIVGDQLRDYQLTGALTPPKETACAAPKVLDFAAVDIYAPAAHPTEASPQKAHDGKAAPEQGGSATPEKAGTAAADQTGTATSDRTGTAAADKTGPAAAEKATEVPDSVKAGEGILENAARAVHTGGGLAKATLEGGEGLIAGAAGTIGRNGVKAVETALHMGSHTAPVIGVGIDATIAASQLVAGHPDEAIKTATSAAISLTAGVVGDIVGGPVVGMGAYAAADLMQNHPMTAEQADALMHTLN
jgi:hypothetical protein